MSTIKEQQRLLRQLRFFTKCEVGDLQEDIIEKSGLTQDETTNHLNKLEMLGLLRFAEVYMNEEKTRKCVFIQKDFKNAAQALMIMFNSIGHEMQHYKDTEKIGMTPGLFNMLLLFKMQEIFVESIRNYLIENQVISAENFHPLRKIIKSWMNTEFGNFDEVISRSLNAGMNREFIENNFKILEYFIFNIRNGKVLINVGDANKIVDKYLTRPRRRRFVKKRLARS